MSNTPLRIVDEEEDDRTEDTYEDEDHEEEEVDQGPRPVILPLRERLDIAVHCLVRAHERGEDLQAHAMKVQRLSAGLVVESLSTFPARLGGVS